VVDVQPDATWSEAAALTEVVGYLNFSRGRPDAKSQRNINELYRLAGEDDAWRRLGRRLGESVSRLRGTSAAFQDVSQAEAVLDVVFDHMLPAYRSHHADLLGHLTDAELFQPFFIARVIEAVLAEGGPWRQADRTVAAALRRLNDFIGHRPIAVLENRRSNEPYNHERLRPIPLFIRDAGVACGKHSDLVGRTIALLGRTPSAILAAAHFHLDNLDELAVDPRVYDFGHPVNQRPNYQFGEWDPHCLDNQSRYRRFVVRAVTLDALLARVSEAADRDAALFESAAVLAGTMLMASAVSGSGPDTHDSTVTLATLLPQIAQLRDAFYAWLLETTPGPAGERLRREAAQLHQPFGGARQFLNHYLADTRAGQLQQVHLARLFAQMGYPGVAGPPASPRPNTAAAPPASARILCEIDCRLTSAHLYLDQGELAAAAVEAEPLETILLRGIHCGALADPWNILGFQGQFSVFPALENSVPDARVDELVAAVEQILLLLSRVRVEAAAAGDGTLERKIARQLEHLARWWDQFASVEVHSVQRVHGGEFVDSSRHTARALAAWRDGGASAGDIRFWREHSEGFTSPRAFAQVIDALLDKNDCIAAMALLMSWLSQADAVPLEQEPHSFHDLAVRWLGSQRAGVRDQGSGVREEEQVARVDWSLVRKFFDFLEANADSYWNVPALELGKTAAEASDERADSASDSDDAEDADKDLFGAAYDGVTFRDSAEDGHDGSIVDGGAVQGDFELEAAAERLTPRLQFLTTVAALWQTVADWVGRSSPNGFSLSPAVGERGRGPTGTPHPDPVPATEGGRSVGTNAPAGGGEGEAVGEFIRSCIAHAIRNERDLSTLLDAIQNTAVPQPLGSHDSMVEFDRRRTTKEWLIERVIATQVETATAVRRLLAVAEQDGGGADRDWRSLAAGFDRTLRAGQSAERRPKLAALLASLAQQPILYRPLAKGGQARQIVAARCVQRVIADLVEDLPRAGLVREAFVVLKTARHMEQSHPVRGEAVSEFDRLFRAAFTAAVEAVVASADHWDPAQRDDERLLECLEELTEHYLSLWLEHSKALRLSVLDRVGGDEWRRISQFVENYGHDLFVPKFLAMGNLRAILDQGVERFLDYLAQEPDPLHPIRLIDDLDRSISRRDAARLLEPILQTFVENYEEYKDYAATAAQAAYGERYFTLLEFLRLKTQYARSEWHLRPVVMVHGVLARLGRHEAAQRWQEAMAARTAELAENVVRQLAELEARHGVRIRTVRDRLHERFVRPLVLDRIVALIEPAMNEALVPASRGVPGRGGAADSDALASTDSFQRLLAELREYSETPTGSGLDLPHWLRVLHDKVDHVRQSRLTGRPARQSLVITPVSYLDLRKQFDDWGRPL